MSAMYVKAFIIITIVLLANGQTIISTPNASNLQAVKATTAATGTTAQKLTLKLQRSPIYAYPGIILDFIVLPAIQRTQDQLESMFQWEFSEAKYLPPRIYISIGQTNDKVRVLLDYQNNIPYKPFVLYVKAKDTKFQGLGTATITTVLDSVSGGITSALHPDDHQDVLR